jgi:phage host-nuclease inhibitor protein Gam
MQWTSEWLRLYPQAKILTADSTDTTPQTRRAFVAKTAANDWDAVIMTASAFSRLPVVRDTERAYLSTRLTVYDTFIQAIRDRDNLPDQTVKQIEKARAREAARIEREMNSEARDVSTCFEQTGIDMLMVDEIHLFKNLTTFSAVDTNSGSQRAADLDMKLMSLRQRHPSGHVLVGATGTPISNTIAEMYVMAHYFRPDMLDDARVGDYDSWVSTFGQLVTRPEIGADSQTFKMKTRLARFVNLPELVTMFHLFGDVKTGDQLDLPRPQLAIDPVTGTRQPQAVVIDRNPELAAYIDTLVGRLDQISRGGSHAGPGGDNALVVLGDGRHASLDTRLRVPGAVGGLKIEAAADILADTWAAQKDHVFLTGNGDPASVPGALQIVFCDLSTPKAGEWSVYQGLKDALVRRGLPADSVRFIHEASTPDQKESLFRSCRQGGVSVLIGSTERMGVGTNIQDRCVLLMNLDCPWKPAELDQRNGRALRQGNQNPNVRIVNLIVKDSFDSLMWQTVERKARFIHQIMDGSLTDRVAEDIADTSDTVALYAEMKAAGTGNPLLAHEAELTADVARYTSLERSWRHSQQGIAWSLTHDEHLLPQLEATAATLREAITRTRSTAGDQFSAQIGQHTWSQDSNPNIYLTDPVHVLSRADAAAALAQIVPRVHRGYPVGIAVVAGHVADITLPVHWTDRSSFDLALRDVPGVTRTVPYVLTPNGVQLSWPGLVTRMENMAESIPAELASIQATIGETRRRLTTNRALQGQPFTHAEHLAQARLNLQHVQEQIAQTTGSTSVIPAGHNPLRMILDATDWTRDHNLGRDLITYYIPADVVRDPTVHDATAEPNTASAAVGDAIRNYLADNMWTTTVETWLSTTRTEPLPTLHQVQEWVTTHLDVYAAELTAAIVGDSHDDTPISHAALSMNEQPHSEIADLEPGMDDPPAPTLSL